MKPSLFDFNGSALRVIHNESGIWFIASDVCRSLEITNPSDALSRIDEEDRTLVSIEGSSNGLPVNAVNESGLYCLTLGSRKPSAKSFKKWVTSEVLPSIRQTGSYSTSPTDADHVVWLVRNLLKAMPAEKLLSMVLPIHEYGSLAPNGKQRHGWRRSAYISAKHRRKEAKELHEKGIVLKYLAQNLQLHEGGLL